MFSIFRQHVFGDLRPYICLEDSCDHFHSGFSRRNEWFRHMVQEHWRTWRCPLGCADSFSTASLFSEHLHQRHGPTTTTPGASLKTKTDLEQARGNCPLCHKFEIADSRQYRSHVGEHLEQLALFVLPVAEEAEDETDEEDEEIDSEDYETEDDSTDEDEKGKTGDEDRPEPRSRDTRY